MSVVKHNDLITAKFSLPQLSAAHGRVVAALVSRVHSRKDESFSYVEILPDEYRKITKNTSYNVEEIEGDLRHLTSMVCRVETDKKVAFCHLVDYAEVEKETGLVRMRLGEEMKPYLLNLHCNYTMFPLDDYLRIKGKHNQRIYELFQKEKNNAGIFRKEYELVELRRMLGLVVENRKGAIVKTLYPRWMNFQKRVLEPARRELCELDTFFDYEPITKGKKIIGVAFLFSPASKSLDEQTFDDYQLIKNCKIDAIDKMDISRCRPRYEIEKALLESAQKNDSSYKDLVKLTPKSRPERLRLMAQKLRNEKARGKLKEGKQRQLDL